jgi:hypothetical protein
LRQAAFHARQSAIAGSEVALPASASAAPALYSTDNIAVVAIVPVSNILRVTEDKVVVSSESDGVFGLSPIFNGRKDVSRRVDGKT